MGTYIILSRISPLSFQDPKDFGKIAKTVSEKIKGECPSITWKESYATTGRFDVIDVVEAENLADVERAAMIIRAYGCASTETLVATPWRQFISEY